MSSTSQADRDFAQKVISRDDQAVRQFSDVYRPYLVGVLRKRGASEADAEELSTDIISDCVSRVGKEPMLTAYEGRSSLQGWLATVATRRWIDIRRRDKFHADIPTMEDEEPTMDSFAAPRTRQPDAELVSLLRGAIDAGFAACPAESLLLLRLVYLHGQSQRDLAKLWSCHESTISRSLSGAMVSIRESALAHITRRDPGLKLSWEDFVELCANGDLQIL